MNTFLPFRDFVRSAKSLDNKRLSNQRRESKTLLNGGWPNHPAFKMWQEYKDAHVVYALAICDECVERGYKASHHLFGATAEYLCFEKAIEFPPWFAESYDYFHLTHQSNLVRKFPEHYKPLFPWVPDNLRYVWPKMKDGRLVGWYESYKFGNKQIQKDIVIPSNEELQELYPNYKV